MEDLNGDDRRPLMGGTLLEGGVADVPDPVGDAKMELEEEAEK